MTRNPLACVLLSALLLSVPPSLPAATPAPLDLSMVRGGAIATDPVVAGQYVYIATGRTLTTWDYGDPAAPVPLGGTEPAGGLLNSLTRHGDHLYASWRGGEGSAGVAVYSIADPARPVLVAENDDYIEDDQKKAFGVVAANDHLYLFDNNHGVLVSALDDPEHLAFAPTPVGAQTEYTRLVAHGDVIHATGRNWMGTNVILTLIDTSQPEAPQVLASHMVDGFDSFSLDPEPGMAIGIGNELTLFDLGTPGQLVPRGNLEILPAIRGLRVGEHYYGFGYSNGLDVWDISDIDAPRAVDHLELRTLGGRHAAALENAALLVGGTDLLQTLDTTEAAHPTLASSMQVPAGTDARDIAFHDGRALLLQPNYGFTVNDPDTLLPLARFEADLPDELAARSFEEIEVSGDRAWLAAWGYGLIGVDLSDPLQPEEVGRLPFPFAAVLAVEGDHAYVAKWTNGGLFAVADVSDPSQPQLLWQSGLEGQPYDLEIDNGHAYLAESAEAGSSSGGLRVFDLADPASPVQVAHLDQGCGSAYDIAIDSEVSLLYLACGSSLQVIDIADPAAPVLVGEHATGVRSQFTKVAQHLDRAWYTNIEGLHEFDVSDPTAPVELRTTRLGGLDAQRLALEDGHLYALGGQTGVHVFAPSGSSATPLENGVPVHGLAGGKGDELLFTLDVPEGAALFHVLSYGGRGDVTMLVKRGSEPTPADADYRSARRGNNETVHVASPEAGTWYIKLIGEQAFSGVGLRANHR